MNNMIPTVFVQKKAVELRNDVNLIVNSIKKQFV
jgi:hypothetical protein